MMEFGLRIGLAQDLQYDQRINDLRYQNQLKKQATIEAQNKAKMFSDDFDFTNAMNEHDNPLVKEFAKGKIREIGQFINQNPDWETSVEKRGMYKQLVRELKDNGDLNRGLQSDQNIKMYNAYMADPKNNEMIETPEFQSIRKQYANYLKYGHQLGEEGLKKEGKKAFMFAAPEEAVDTHKILVDLAKATEYDMRSGYGYDGYRQSISKDRKLQAVEHAISSGQWGKYLKKDYDKYLSQLNENEKTNAKTLNQFTLERMEPYFNSEKIDIGHQAPVIRPPARGGKGTDAGMNRDMWLKMHQESLTKKGGVIEFGPDAMQATFGNKYGEMNLNGVVSPLGDPINLGLTKATSTGIVTVKRMPNGMPEANHKVMVRMPVEQFYSLGDGYKKVVDEGGIGQIFPGGPSNEKTNWDIHKEYSNDFKKYTDDKGRDFVEFAVNHKYDPLNVHYADSYSNAHNVSPHKENPYEMYGNEGQPKTIIQNGYTYTFNEATGQYE